jgi:hypothetical protein
MDTRALTQKLKICKLLDWLIGPLNDRQQKALLRMFRKGPAGFKEGLSAGKYSFITGASPTTTKVVLKSAQP